MPESPRDHGFELVVSESIFDFEEDGVMHEAYFTPHVCVIESPGRDDRAVGRREGVMIVEALKLANIRHRLFDVEDRDSLLKAIAESADFCTTRIFETPDAPQTAGGPRKVSFARPFVHFSCHGNEDGIGLTNGDFISWPELGRLLLEMTAKIGSYSPGNELSGLLTVCMSSCSGLHARKMATPTACPFSSLVGCGSAVTWTDSVTAFTTFYHQVITKHRTVPRAVKAINDSSLQHDVFELVSPRDVGVPGFTDRPVVVVMVGDAAGNLQWVYDLRRNRPHIPVIWPKDDVRDLVTGEPLFTDAPYFDDPAAAVEFMRANPGRPCQVERCAAQEIEIGRFTASNHCSTSTQPANSERERI